MVKQADVLDIMHAPYKGGAALTAVMGGHVSALAVNQDNVLQHAEAGADID